MCGWQPTAISFLSQYRPHQLVAPRAWTSVREIRQETYLVRTYWYGCYRHMRRLSFLCQDSSVGRTTDSYPVCRWFDSTSWYQCVQMGIWRRLSNTDKIGSTPIINTYHSNLLVGLPPQTPTPGIVFVWVKDEERQRWAEPVIRHSQ